MGENTAIEWCDHTFNPWWGCQKVSAACDNCYAEAWSERWSTGSWGPHAARVRTSTRNWHQPVRWDMQAAEKGTRPRVFCASMADVFDNHGSITSGWHGDLWHLIARTPNLDWLLLTKRPQNIAKMLPETYGAPAWGDGWPNVWLGTTVENQQEADRRIPHLLSVPARVRFLSCEPLLGQVDLEPWLAWPDGGCELPDGSYFGCADCEMESGPSCKCPRDRAHYFVEEGPRDDTGCPEYVHAERVTLDWIIAGGESGKNARPTHPDWFRSLRDQCAGAGVPFLFKQWGEWAPTERSTAAGDTTVWPNGSTGPGNANDGGGAGREMNRVGKKRAGRTLDGVVHDGFPAPVTADA